MAKEGELPEVFERKIWGRAEEGLFITSGIVILLANTFDLLEEVSMMGSAAFLLIYNAVNIAHLRIRRETGANKYIVLAAIVCNSLALIIITQYMLMNSPKALLALAIAITLSFTVEKFTEL